MSTCPKREGAARAQEIPIGGEEIPRPLNRLATSRRLTDSLAYLPFFRFFAVVPRSGEKNAIPDEILVGATSDSLIRLPA
jgi:hypothetical protein